MLQRNKQNRNRILVVGAGTFGNYIFSRLKAVGPPSIQVDLIEFTDKDQPLQINLPDDYCDILSGAINPGLGGLTNIWGGNLVQMSEWQYARCKLSNDLSYFEYQSYCHKVLKHLSCDQNLFEVCSNCTRQTTSWLALNKRRFRNLISSNVVSRNIKDFKIINSGAVVTVYYNEKQYQYDYIFLCCGGLNNFKILNNYDQDLFNDRSFLTWDHSSFKFKGNHCYERELELNFEGFTYLRPITQRLVDLELGEGKQYTHLMLHRTYEMSESIALNMIKTLLVNKKGLLESRHNVKFHAITEILRIMGHLLFYRKVPFSISLTPNTTFDFYTKSHAFSVTKNIKEQLELVGSPSFQEDEAKAIAEIIRKIATSDVVDVLRSGLAVHPVGEFNDRFNWIDNYGRYYKSQKIFPISTMSLDTTASANSSLTVFAMIERAIENMEFYEL